jgi:hypothetical protein
MRSTLLLLAAAVFLASANATPADPAPAGTQLVSGGSRNLIPNGGFEAADPADPSAPLGWSVCKSAEAAAGAGPAPAPDSQVNVEWVSPGYTGKKCISLSTDTTLVIGTWTSAPVEVKPNHDYIVRFVFKTDVPGRGPGNISALDEKGARLVDLYIPESSLWTPFEYRFNTGPTSRLSIQFMLYHRERQRYFFDDAQLLDVGSAPTITLPEDASTTRDARLRVSWTGSSAGAFQVDVSQSRDLDPSKTMSLRVTGRSSCTLPKPLPDGTWYARVTVIDPGGERFTSSVVSVLVNTSGAGVGRRMDTTPPSVWGFIPLSDSRLQSSPTEISFECDDVGTGIDPKSAKMTINGTSVEAQYVPESRRFICRPVRPLGPGSHIVTVSARDRAGNSSGDMTWGFFVNWDSPDRVEIDASQRLRVNGRPFFMVGIYTHSFADRESTVRSFAESGINTFWGGTNEENFQNNMKTLHNVQYWKPIETVEEDLQAKMVDPVTRSLILFHTADEPDAASPEAMTALRDMIKHNDPHHPTGWILSMPASYKALAPTTDIVVEDHYPVLKSKDYVAFPNYMGIANAIELQRQATGGKKPVMAVIQAFDWEVDRGGKVMPEEHRPTADEVFLMSCIALIHEAQGILLYPAGDVTILDRLMSPARKLRYLSPALLAPTLRDAVKLTSGADSIRLIAKPAPGGMIIVAVNPTNAPVMAKFSVDKRAREVRVMYEDRTVDCKSGRFSDIFAPASSRVFFVAVKHQDG